MHRDRLGHRARFALLLAAALLVGLAFPPGGAQDIPAHVQPTYFLGDPAGDVATTSDPIVGQIVPPPGFSDIDLRNITLYEDRGAAGDQAAQLVVLITTEAAIESGADFQVRFNVTKGPTSLPTSTANGRGFAFTATAAAGATAASVSIPVAALGVGGDLLANLTVTSTRFDDGDLPVAQDDSTGTDQAPDAGTAAPPYTLHRPPAASLWTVEVTGIGATTGSTATLPAGSATIDIQLNITNGGLDEEGYSLSVTADPPLDEPPVFTLELRLLPGGGSETRTVPISLAGVEGTLRLTFTVTGERGGKGTDSAILTLAAPAIPPAQRDVVPAGLDFLTPAAEGLGFDGAFGKYAELALLALLVLLAILAIFLLLALAPSTLKGAASDEAPPLPPESGSPTASAASTARAAPAVPTPRPSTPATATPGAPTAGAVPPAPVPATTGLRIASVAHEPPEPEPGQEVATEVVLRNDGSTRQVRVVLARDGTDIDEATLTLPAYATKNVRLAWTAGDGDNRIKVRVLPA